MCCRPRHLDLVQEPRRPRHRRRRRQAAVQPVRRHPGEPAKHPHVKKELGQQFIDWLISAEGQKAIADYKIDGEQLFFPNDRPGRAKRLIRAGAERTGYTGDFDYAAMLRAYPRWSRPRSAPRPAVNTVAYCLAQPGQHTIVPSEIRAHRCVACGPQAEPAKSRRLPVYFGVFGRMPTEVCS
jgi:hypothetical protein